MPAPRRTLIPTETLLRAARSAAERLSHLSRDPEVRRDAAEVARSVAKLLASVRRAGHPPRRP
ncbi:hypothetical protein [Deinococcus radiotolerans]|uniref:Uncharacterized protein n=1 Tax=Deinococcus radiotolerans TaxID=1309407 RepID=A0ABQ2FKL0_9DEIO|nr:hypothetical protein [Deinococcus radiotolerans]GGK98134.1 hypothetical protein GCM10010844_15520 [Deinococcus radiotolerans]